MRGVQISYLIEHPEYISQLAQWLLEQWGSILGEETPEARIKKLKKHMNRDKLPIAWVAHANGHLLGTAGLRVHDLEAETCPSRNTGKATRLLLLQPVGLCRTCDLAICLVSQGGCIAQDNFTVEQQLLFGLAVIHLMARFRHMPRARARAEGRSSLELGFR